MRKSSSRAASAWSTTAFPTRARILRPPICPHRLRTVGAAAKNLSGGNMPGTPVTVKVLFLAHIARGKKACSSRLRVCCAANRELARRKLPMQLKLITAGNFVTDEEQSEFNELLKTPPSPHGDQSRGFRQRRTQGAVVTARPTCSCFRRNTWVKTSR
jgi:hypothetical protein